jgi:hypothetical protein
MRGKIIRAPRNESDQGAETNIKKFLHRMKRDSKRLKEKLTVALEVTKKPRLKKTIREVSLMENLALIVDKTEILLPLISDNAKEDHMLVVELEGLIGGFSAMKGEKKLLSDYTEEKIRKSEKELKAMRELMDQQDRASKRLTSEWTRTYNELKLMRRFVEFGFVGNVGRAKEVMQEAKKRVEMRILKIIKDASPDLIIVHRYLMDVDPLGYEDVGMVALSLLQPTPFPLPRKF